MWLNPPATRLLAGLYLVVTLVDAFPHLEIERSPTLPSVQATESYISELERELEDLRRTIRVNKDYQKANEYIRDLAEESRQKIKDGTFDSCATLKCSASARLESISQTHDACVCIPIEVLTDFSIGQSLLEDHANRTLMKARRAEDFVLDEKDENPGFTYIPPPKTDVTPELLAQSLANQPQDTATINSVMPYFAEDVIVYGAQMNGFVAATLSLNASTEIPCDGIGSPIQPVDLEVRPKDVYNGTAQAYVPDCSIVAINMYNPNIINYWVQTRNGTMHSMIGSNKIVNIDQLNTTASVSLVIRAKKATARKRDLTSVESLKLGRAIAARAIERRAIVPPDSHTATMSEAACAAMICNNNDGQPAVFNQFTRMCGCREPSYVEVDHSS